MGVIFCRRWERIAGRSVDIATFLFGAGKKLMIRRSPACCYSVSSATRAASMSAVPSQASFETVNFNQTEFRTIHLPCCRGRSAMVVS